jgi:hypothetical protein
METEPLPCQPDADLQLQRDTHYQAVDTLRGMLPPPCVDTPEAWLLRDNSALVLVTGLVPVSAPEARLAGNYVAALEHASDCMHQAGLQDADPKRADQLRNQASRMRRDACGYYATLVRMQATRQKREANPVTCDSAALTERCMLGMMQEALASMPPGAPRARAVAAPAPAPAAAAPAPPPAAAAPAPAAAEQPPAPAPRQFVDYDDWPEEVKHKYRVCAEADRYAIVHTMQAQLIRRLGRVPDNCDFELPEPEVLEALITGNNLNLQWCDSYVPWKPPAEE